MPERFAPRMSVSSRSPMTSGCCAPNRATAASKMARSGLPATIGRRPTAVCTAETSVPLPGAVPRACGIVQSVFVATHGMSSRGGAARSANAASARSVQATCGANPWITAAGESSAERVIRNPARSSSLVSPSPPTTRISEPAGTSSASSLTAACGDETTSSGTTVSPSSFRCAATDAVVREALFVRYPTRMPDCCAALIASTACGIGPAPAYTTPSRSARIRSTPSSGDRPGRVSRASAHRCRARRRPDRRSRRGSAARPRALPR